MARRAIKADSSCRIHTRRRLYSTVELYCIHYTVLYRAVPGPWRPDAGRPVPNSKVCRMQSVDNGDRQTIFPTDGRAIISGGTRKAALPCIRSWKRLGPLEMASLPARVRDLHPPVSLALLAILSLTWISNLRIRSAFCTTRMLPCAEPDEVNLSVI